MVTHCINCKKTLQIKALVKEDLDLCFDQIVLFVARKKSMFIKHQEASRLEFH